ncbi:anthranilate phosphoribosyltransferase [Sphingomonas carotinifaciens]|uniref:Anthranilate phosphoribosyltransferase n=1 Tax=Sphingomonas carotinifaciens TaxID=1166323 RepID=A0A1G7IEF3_9SPHN|nr:anthranilate phosphoribosyltransferase [Sphingomonas carotinifaciens]MBB4084908.1 anthranilate phosphoribosyltransferase [Sphingomonas carotinifaciens]MWC44291.1 anthranilate phosphoribosyltransferase [Sphingomonas carotinifaciens]SDF10874.1 anthranilate phosphoribosyltransferase [Sphingomonas carotinifaciens]
MTTVSLLPDTASPLSRESARVAFADILDGRATEAAIIAFLTGLTERGETAIEIAEAARALRERVVPIQAPPGTVDVCGTGGDGHHTLNVSTAVALVVAALGVPVAKHGNRAASSKAGAADTLEALGLDMDRAGAVAEASLADLGIAFLFAANHHPAMKRITPIRRAIGRRTIFNLMGPLANPAHVTRQLIGIARPDYAPLYAEALNQLGTQAALVVSGEEGLDELSGAGPSIAVSVGTLVAPATITPEDAGLPRHPVSAIRGGDAAHNAAALQRLLAGEEGAYRDAVLLNAAAALLVAGHSTTLGRGAVAAARVLDDGAAARLLDQWIAYR